MRSCNFDVIRSDANNVSVDVGADGDIEWNYPDVLNTTTSPRIVNASTDDLISYIIDNCANQDYCLIPISFSLSSAGVIGIDNLNLTQNLDELVFTNLSLIENKNPINMTINFTNSKLLLYDLDLEFKGSKNISLFLHASNESRINTSIVLKVFYSKFNYSFPKGITSHEIIFLRPNQSNMTIQGQKFRHCNTSVDDYCAHSSTPIFNITMLGYDQGADFYLSANSTINNSINHSFDIGVNRTRAFQVSGPIPVRMFDNLTINNSKSVFEFLDFFDMTWSKLSRIDFSYDFDFTSFCSSCVR